jgi:hypothetical protein
MTYFDKEEQKQMLEEMWEFDRNMIHEKYQLVRENLQKKRPPNLHLQLTWPLAECFRWCVLWRWVEYNGCSPAKPTKPLSHCR